MKVVPGLTENQFRPRAREQWQLRLILTRKILKGRGDTELALGRNYVEHIIFNRNFEGKYIGAHTPTPPPASAQRIESSLTGVCVAFCAAAILQ